MTVDLSHSAEVVHRVQRVILRVFLVLVHDGVFEWVRLDLLVERDSLDVVVRLGETLAAFEQVVLDRILFTRARRGGVVLLVDLQRLGSR